MVLSVSISIFLQTQVVGCVGILWVFYVQILLANLASKKRQLLNVGIFFPTLFFPELKGKKQTQLVLVCAGPLPCSP